MSNRFDILTIDDDPTILDVYKTILLPSEKTSIEEALAELERLHGGAEVNEISPNDQGSTFAVNQANNGLDGVDLFKRLYDDGKSISVCIIDMRMPNGIDGLETASRIKAIDPDVNIIISTAYSDKSAKEISGRIKDNIYYVRKPFHAEEIYQLVYSLSLSFKATKAFQRLNLGLEDKIRNEIEKSRQKDAIMLHQAKLAAYGEMIGNIAHQWRQPLSILTMILNKLNIQFKVGSLTEESLNESISNAFDTIDFMTQTINDFREQVEPSKEKVTYSLVKSIEKTIAIVQKSFSMSGITISLNIPQEIKLFGFPEDIKQIALNLLNNAKDAIISNDISDGVININGEFKGEKLVVTINDNGGGIKEEAIEHLFEPYFTTKHKSQGTGIGLYMTKRIVEERLDGLISAYNTSIGACFCIELDIYQNAMERKDFI